MIRVFLTNGQEIKVFGITSKEMHEKLYSSLSKNWVIELQPNVYVNPYAIAWYKETA